MMKVLIIDNGSTYTNQLLELFQNSETKIVPFDSSYRLESENFDLIILSGGHIYDPLDNQKAYSKEIDLIRKSTTPILGICLGCEIIVIAFGGELENLDQREKGAIKVNVIRKDRLFDDNVSSFIVYENHKKVIKSLPECLEALATSADGIEIFKHKDKPIYGMQFHPEMSKDIAENNQLIENLINLVDHD